MAFKFTSAECATAAEELNTSSERIGELIEEFNTLIDSVRNNYRSDASEKIVEAFNKIKQSGPAFQQSVADCSRYLTDTVAPAYEKLEKTAQSKVEGI